MTNHKWIADVLEDLETYAAKNEIGSLQCLLREARSTFESEIEAAVALNERGEQSRLNFNLKN